jgi:hypothetical protein
MHLSGETAERNPVQRGRGAETLAKTYGVKADAWFFFLIPARRVGDRMVTILSPTRDR